MKHGFAARQSCGIRDEVPSRVGTEVSKMGPTGPFRNRVGELFKEIAEHHGFEIEEMEIAVDHVHIFLSFPPRYSIGKVVGMVKSISANEIFEEFPKVKKELWGGEFWEDGYFARTVGQSNGRRDQEIHPAP